MSILITMETKICSKCGVEKKLDEYYISTKSKDGRASACKECRKPIDKLYREKNKELISKKSKVYRDNNVETYKKKKQKYYQKNKDEVLKRNKEWRENNKTWIKDYNTKYQIEKKELIKKRRSKYREKNKETLNNSTKKWIIINHERYLLKKREYRKSEIGLKKKREWHHRTKDKYNHLYAWRALLHNALKRFGTKKQDTTIKLLGYSATDLKNHIENQFEEGMTWDNWGEWHIDHKRPVINFDKNEKQSVVNALDNLQPLWAHENLSKNKKNNKK